jgi:hypothetical protein
MHAVSPPVAQLVLDGASGEIQPVLIQVGAQLVGTRHPHKNWSDIGHDLEQKLGDWQDANVRVPSHVTTSPQ